jgi:hypothetical protein
MRTLQLTLIGAALVALSSTADAQKRGKAGDKVPPGHLPPPGLCRVWIDGVPPGRQPAATDCQTAIATRPANARILYGDDTRKSRRGDGDGDWTWRREDQQSRDRERDRVRDGERRDSGDWSRVRTDAKERIKKGTSTRKRGS